MNTQENTQRRRELGLFAVLLGLAIGSCIAAALIFSKDSTEESGSTANPQTTLVSEVEREYVGESNDTYYEFFAHHGLSSNEEPPDEAFGTIYTIRSELINDRATGAAVQFDNCLTNGVDLRVMPGDKPGDSQAESIARLLLDPDLPTTEYINSIWIHDNRVHIFLGSFPANVDEPTQALDLGTLISRAVYEVGCLTSA